ncbi:GntR family transcriptional regulator [Agrobacterium sp. ICMP 6402]|uniref:amidohydrolase family protein n=1 Tax=Agrobacterium sp. ICMP 6402 TaxID=2292443 RepID=UPI001297BBFC|nr:amidohydrolase family protein [Agrobacterium sp. ICMP 6402]MQB12372.1 GntR family transcriptional regulator [Agrobacterium sp. ICMP 6402]
MSTLPAPPPSCPSPDGITRPAQRLKLPVGAVDCHAHVIGSAPDFPLIENRSYTPVPVSSQDYLAMLSASSVTFGVLVQISVHGNDNQYMQQALRAAPGRLRGIAVIGPQPTERECNQLADDGVVGLRINAMFRGGASVSKLERYADICRDRGWHLQLLVDGNDIAEVGQTVSRLRVPVVFDHMGHPNVEVGLEGQGFKTLLGLVRDGAWVKLSGAYRFSQTLAPYDDVLPFARALYAAAPERCLWGSDWPHVAHWGPMMNVGDLLDALADWLPEEKQQIQVLTTNPQRLYGFASATSTKLGRS